MQLNWSLVVSAVIFLFTWIVLGRLLLRPLIQVLEERSRRTSGVFENTDEYEDDFKALTETYDRKLKEERLSGFKQAEKVRNKALSERQEKIQSARKQAGSMLNQAKDEIQIELEDAKKRLHNESEEIAKVISDRVLGVS